MKLIVLGSSSHGNGYIISDSQGNALLLEAGVEPKLIRQAVLNYNLNLRTCLVSHRHGDHARYLRDILRMGISTFAHPSVFDGIDRPIHYIHRVNENFSIDTPDRYHVRFFLAEHDAPCLAFYITHPEGSIFFLTDTMYFRKVLPRNLSLAMVECNYDDHTLQYNIAQGITDPAMNARLQQTHLELQTTVGILTATSGTRHQLLLHLSADNADPDLMLRQVQQATATPTTIASPGLVLDF